MALARFLYLIKLFLVERVLDRKINVLEAPAESEILWKGLRKQPGGGICLFAHYDPSGDVADYVLRYLREIQDKGGFEIVFLSTAPYINPPAIDSLKDLVYLLIRRPNIGIDFGSWSCGLGILDQLEQQYDSVLLANDSVYGPIGDLSEIFRRAQNTDKDFVGLMDSRENGYHLQSFFLLLKKRTLASAFLREFKQHFKYGLSRRSIIWRYEIGLTQKLQAEGLSGLSLFSSDQYGNPGSNATMNRGLDLVKYQNFPFIKRKVIGKLMNANDLSWKKIVSDIDSVAAEQILEHQRR